MPNEAWPLISVIAVAIALAAAGLAMRRGRDVERLHGGRAEDSPAGGAGDLIVDRQELMRMADILAIGLLRISPEGTVVLANDAAHRYLNRKSGGLVGRTTMEAFIDHRIGELTRLARAGGPAHRELTFPGEPPVTLNVRAQRASHDDGLWVVLEDVSELRRLQRIRAEFIDNLSHELRTPLTTVRLLAEGLQLELERTEVPPRIRDSILKIEIETGHLVQMVNELLDLSQIEQGEASLRSDEVDLGAVVEGALARLRLYAERQAVSLRLEMPADAAERRLLGDEERLGQLLLNLLHNAVKFSPDGGDVLVRLSTRPDELLLEIEDEGVGIPTQDLDRIFERFYKVDRARRREGGGTGLGLAIARHIVERHGGRIWADSEEGRGSRFSVALPRQGRT